MKPCSVTLMPLEDEEFRNGIRRIVEGEFAPLMDAEKSLSDFTPAMIDAAARNGLLGVRISPEFGGSGLSLREYCIVQQEFARVNPVLSLLGSATSGLGPMAIERHGTDAQKHRYLPRLTQGARTAFALTESEAGSDASAIRTTATAISGGWKINGTKQFITCADAAEVLVVMAVTDAKLGARGGITAFLVDQGTPGLAVTRIDRTFGSPAWTLAEIHFEDCFVPAENVLGEVGRGFRIAMESLDEGRLNVASICLGAAQKLLELSIDYAKTRQTFGKSLSANQSIQWMLVDSAVDITATEALLERAFEAQESSRPLGPLASMAKLFASEMAGRVADRAVQIHGANGLVEGSAVGTAYRDLRIFRIGEGASEIQRIVIARELLA